MSALEQDWIIFPSAMGVCGMAWCEQGVTHFALPDASEKIIVKNLKTYTGNNYSCDKPPAWVKTLIKAVKAHLKGKVQDFSKVPTHFVAASDFVASVYQHTQQIPSGTVLSYGELAMQLGKPGASRAVGSALGQNPIPLIVPCHRIVAASGKLGGFSSPGGLQTKLKLLDAEGVCLTPPEIITNNAQWLKAIAKLQKQDKLFAQLTKTVKPFSFQPHLSDEPVESLTQAIVSQQLSTKVAATIMARVHSLTQEKGRISPQKIMQLSNDALRQAGLSQMKVSFLKDLAQHYLDGKLSSLEKLHTMSNEQIIKEFTQIKGVGRWTVEMFLIFNLGRADVFPVLDFGVRKGVARLYQLKELPDPKQMDQYGDCWRPYRSVASLYLWRSLDNE